MHCNVSQQKDLLCFSVCLYMSNLGQLQPHTVIEWRLLECLSIIFLNEIFWMFTVNFYISLCLDIIYPPFDT